MSGFSVRDELKACAQDVLRVGGHASVLTDHDVETQARLTIKLIVLLEAAEAERDRALADAALGRRLVEEWDLAVHRGPQAHTIWQALVEWARQP